MMANEAPEKIYINSDIENRTWLIGKGDISFIEYTRTDAFIDKACDAYCKVCKMPNCRSNECKFISEFKRHLENM